MILLEDKNMKTKKCKIAALFLTFMLTVCLFASMPGANLAANAIKFNGTIKEIISDLEYDDIYGFSEGLAAVHKDGKWSILEFYANESSENTTPKNPFTDVKETDWFCGDVKTAYESGLINGTSPTTFSPGNNLTYAEAVTLAARMHQLHTTGSVTLASGSPVWYQTYVDYAKANKIIGADYDWTAPATRAGYMAIFANALPDDALAAINPVADGAIPDVPDGLFQTC